MPWELLSDIPELKDLNQILRRRVTDTAFRQFSEREVTQLVDQYLLTATAGMHPEMLPGYPINSFEHARTLKDLKMHIGTLNHARQVLGDRITSWNQEVRATLSDIQNELKVLTSGITEQETRIVEGYDKSHYNAFVREQDASTDSYVYKVDPKTQISFLDEHNIDPRDEATLPLKGYSKIFVKDVFVVGEDSDTGSLGKPYLETPANNLIRPGKIFRYVVALQEHDVTSRKYTPRKATMSLLLDLGSDQLVNRLKLEVLGNKSLTLSAVKYLNEAKQEITLSSSSLDAQSGFEILFEPVRTRYLKLDFEQYASVAKGLLSSQEDSLAEVAKALGLEFVPTSSVQEIEGALYDFSLYNLELGLATYLSKGRFEAKPISVENFVGASLATKLGGIHVVNSVSAYGDTPFLASDGDFVETYLGVQSSDTKRLFPVPASYPSNVEALPFIGGIAKLRFFPDLLSLQTGVEVVSSVVSATELTITTATAHGLSVADEVVFYGNISHALSTEFTVATVPNATSFTISGSYGSEYAVDESTWPSLYVVQKANVVSPLSVYRESTLLTLGTDYSVSFDSGSTWQTAWKVEEFAALHRKAEAFTCLVKFFTPDYAKPYWVQYSIHPNQKLDDNTRLVSGAVVLQQPKNAVLTTLIILRAESRNVFVTPIVYSYLLKVRQQDGV